VSKIVWGNQSFPVNLKLERTYSSSFAWGLLLVLGIRELRAETGGVSYAKLSSFDTLPATHMSLISVWGP
jgi:hypothetical protein